METAAPTSGKAVAAFLAGVTSVVCGVLTLATRSDWFLVGIILFWLLAIVLGVRSRAEIRRADDQLNGKTLAGWGMGVPAVGFALGFLLLPAT